MLGKKRPLGKMIDQLKVGDSYQTSHKIEDKELLLYLGLTNDANPLYLQHDYASQTPYKCPIVPSVLLFGVVSSIVSMKLPGPGSHILQHDMAFLKPVTHYATVTFRLEIKEIDMENHQVIVIVTATDNRGDHVLKGSLVVCPPYQPKSTIASSLENFY
ncbi:MaoC/PaaZ C-terminal domain-containing protein [Sediminibacillus albus]|uniref:Acyl dehydratase n=1 Tax=Sediminibacillus albus TaxID=407036 RepID=A0A1G9BTJ9_9BACI|nr:MaoC/PaaZ C-terminal domain-containing protein [Sediminibacillus albus]SDK42767.1 Acyl dehydratase [Sediminibacillus albus]